MVWGGGHLPDLPRPLPPHPGARPHRHGGGAQRPHRLGRGAGVPPRPKRRGAQPGLLRRQPGRRAGEAALPAGPGGGHPLLLPRVRGAGEPPLRHRRLREDRPHAGHRGRLQGPVRRRPPAGHAGDAGRRVQPPGLCQPVLQRRRLLPERGRRPVPGQPLLPLVPLLPLARPLRLLVGHLLPARRGREPAHLPGLHLRRGEQHHPPLAERRGGRLAAGRGRRAARRLRPRHPCGRPAGQARRGGHRRGVGGRLQQDRLRRAPQAHPGRPLRRADELPLPQRPALLPAGGRRLPLQAGHGDHPGELSPLRLALRHELPGHPRHPPHPHPAGGGGRRQGSLQGLAGRLPHERRAVPAGQGPAQAGGPGALRLPRLPHHLLRGRGRAGGL